MPIEEDFSQFARTTRRRARTVIRRSTRELVKFAYARTPHYTGYMMSSWNVAIDGQTYETTGYDRDVGNIYLERDTPYEASPVAERVDNKLRTVNLFPANTEVRIYNPVFYARHIEFGNEKKPGRHIMQRTVDAAPEIVRRVKKDIRKEGRFRNGRRR